MADRGGLRAGNLPTPDVSIVVPVYNESGNLPLLFEQILIAMEGLKFSFELILVDDGSIDDSFKLMSAMAADDQRVKVVRLRRNFGQTAAMSAGFSAASGEWVVSLDGDLQNDPADIGSLLDKAREGYDVVSGWRRVRKDHFLTRRLPSILANRLISRMTGVRLHDYGCTLKLYRRDVLQDVNLYGEMHRFIPALASQVGAKVAEIPVNHRPRHAGTSKYGLDRTMRVVLDLVTVKFLLNYATRPLHLFGKWGLFAILLGGMSGSSAIYMRLFNDLHLNRNPLTVLTAFMIFTGVQLIALGLLGELMTRIYHESQAKPVYIVRETRNIE